MWISQRVVGWSASHHVDHPCGGEISPWPARKVTECLFIFLPCVGGGSLACLWLESKQPATGLRNENNFDHPTPHISKNMLPKYAIKWGIVWLPTFHSRSKENQVSLVRIFLSEPGSGSKISRLGVEGGRLILRKGQVWKQFWHHPPY